MEFYHTFWSKPLLEKRFNNDLNKLISTYVYCYTLSYYFIKKFGYKINIVTDSIGYEMLNHLDYDNVYIYDDLYNDNVNFAAKYKFKAMEIANLGDAIIDEDLFLYKQECFDIINKLSKKSDLVYSYYENAVAFLNPLIDKLDNYNLTYSIDRNNMKYPNCSLTLINNQKLKDEYINQYIANLNILQDFNFDAIWVDIILEQYFLDKIIEKNNYKISNITYPRDDEYSDKIGYWHTAGTKYDKELQIINMLISNDYDLFIKATNKKCEIYRKLNLTY